MRLLTVLFVLVAFAGAVTGCTDGSRPSDEEIRSCVLDAPPPNPLRGDTNRAVFGSIARLEFDPPFTSQGTFVEKGMGAPAGTRIFPTTVHFPDGNVRGYWVFRDSWGKPKCVAR